jgi:hypothetical protein
MRIMVLRRIQGRLRKHLMGKEKCRYPMQASRL